MGMMKKLILLLFIVVLFSCEKDTTCYTCFTFITRYYPGGTEELIKVKKFCDVTEADMRHYEKSTTAEKAGECAMFRQATKCYREE